MKVSELAAVLAALAATDPDMEVRQMHDEPRRVDHQDVVEPVWEEVDEVRVHDGCVYVGGAYWSAGGEVDPEVPMAPTVAARVDGAAHLKRMKAISDWVGGEYRRAHSAFWTGDR